MSFSILHARVTAAAICSLFAATASIAQISPTAETAVSASMDESLPTVRSLVTSSSARYAVVSKSVERDAVRATIVLTKTDGSTIGGYGAPYLENKEHTLALWRDFISTNLNMLAHPDDLTVIEHRAAADASFGVAFVLDHSPSTTMPRAIRMQRAVQTALSQFAPADYVSVVKFTGRINVEVPVSNDKEEYASKFQVNGLNMRVSGSAVYDAAIRGIEQIAESTVDRRLVILFTDGEDNASSSTMLDVIALAKKTNTQIHTVTYGVGDEAVLSALANETGGRTHQLRDVYDFDKVFMGIYASMRHSYDLVVRTSNSPRNSADISNAVISSSAPVNGKIQPSELFALMPTKGVQLSNASTRSDQSLTLNVDLRFEGEASEISAADVLMLDSIATVMVQRADLALQIVPGNDDATVAPQDVVIAQRRATAVRDLLIRRGVHPSRVQGFSSRPSSTPQPRGTTPKTTFVFTKM